MCNFYNILYIIRDLNIYLIKVFTFLGKKFPYVSFIVLILLNTSKILNSKIGNLKQIRNILLIHIRRSPDYISMKFKSFQSRLTCCQNLQHDGDDYLSQYYQLLPLGM